MYDFLFYFILFLIYSIVGWVIEVFVMKYETNRWMDRGFLVGPFCPIYGFGGTYITIILGKYKSNLFMFFICTVITTTILEYLTSFIMEKLFKARWWDYTNKAYNLNGRICLLNSLAFGIMGSLLTYIINPILINKLTLIPKTTFTITSTILLIMFILDIIVSFIIINKLKTNFETLKLDRTEEINDHVKKSLRKNINALKETSQKQLEIIKK